MKRILTFCLIFIVICLSSVNAQSGWELIYENDENGKAKYGELKHLIKAIRDGESIRVFFIMGRGENLVEHTADIKFSTVMNSPNGQFVMGQLDTIIG